MSDMGKDVASQATVADERPKFLRHKEQGFFKLKRDCWGERYEKSRDPEGIQEIPGKLWLANDFSKLPAEQWARVVSLYFKLLDPNNKVVDAKSEVSVVFARRGPDFQQWRTFVPKQTVGSGSVDADLTKLVDIVTGEELDGFPEDWFHAGSSHSHNTMNAFFSDTDDRNELDVPGMHIVVGEMEDSPGRKLYRPLASIVSAKVRHIVPFRAVVDSTPLAFDPHPKVLEYIKKHEYKTFTSANSDADDYSEFGFFSEDNDGVWRHRYKKDEDKAKERQVQDKRRRRSDDSEPRFQKEADDGCRSAAMTGDMAALNLRLAVVDARRAAKGLPDKEARAIHRLCDAVQSCRMNKAALDLAWKLICEADDASRAYQSKGD